MIDVIRFVRRFVAKDADFQRPASGGLRAQIVGRTGLDIAFLVERLNARGGSGWQLVSILPYDFYVFVREIQEAELERSNEPNPLTA
jgi:hypothetical protein